jgi:hypothetical protein
MEQVLRTVNALNEAGFTGMDMRHSFYLIFMPIVPHRRSTNRYHNV